MTLSWFQYAPLKSAISCSLGCLVLLILKFGLRVKSLILISLLDQYKLRTSLFELHENAKTCVRQKSIAWRLSLLKVALDFCRSRLMTLSVKFCVQQGFSEELLRFVIPSVGSKLLSLNTAVAEVGDAQVRLVAFPLKGGVAKKSNNQENVDPYGRNKILGPLTIVQQCQLVLSGISWSYLQIIHGFEKGKDRLKQVPFQQLGSQVGGIAFATEDSVEGFGQHQSTHDYCGFAAWIEGDSEQRALFPGAPFAGATSCGQRTWFKEAVQENGLAHHHQGRCVSSRWKRHLQQWPWIKQLLPNWFLRSIHSLASGQTLQHLKDHPLETFQKTCCKSALDNDGGVSLCISAIESSRRCNYPPVVDESSWRTPSDLLQIFWKARVVCSSVLAWGWNLGSQFVGSVLSSYNDDARAARQLGESLEGSYVGLALTSKGLAIRALNSALASARDIVFAGWCQIQWSQQACGVSAYLFGTGFSFPCVAFKCDRGNFQSKPRMLQCRCATSG